MRRKRSESQRNMYVFDCTVPPRIESQTMVLFFCLCVGRLATEIYNVTDDSIFSSASQVITRYLADCTSIICTIIFPLLVLLGGRNNLVQYLTRWNFFDIPPLARQTLNDNGIYSCYLLHFVIQGSYYTVKIRQYLVWVAVAVTSGYVLTVQSLLYLRRR